MIKALLSWLVLLLITLIPLNTVRAAGEFRADYDVSYAISPSGNTIVTQNITLTNKLTNLYPKQYSILIDSTRIKNVIAYDKGGMISPKISQKNGKTEIFLEFNEQVVGIGKQLNFILRYENAEIAQKVGNIWEVYVPGIAEDSELGSYNVSLQVSTSFSPNAYMTPLPASSNIWTKEQMVNGGISAAYGEVQIFKINLAYFLQNLFISPQIKEITLPPDTSYQKVIIDSINPKPLTITRDEDGNWIAQYQLDPGKNLEIEVAARIAIYLKSREGYEGFDLDEGKYLKPLKFWETKDPAIVSLAQEYRTPREIYNYVVKTLTYDYNQVNQGPIRKGAVQALNSPKNSVCTEFTDLFIAIARAAGIPARQALGFAYTTNAKLRPLSLVSDVLHAWPEYYDRERKIWVPIDPTWADTTGGVNYFDKLDFNHLVFAIQGISSEYPLPAGFYKKSNSSGKDISVTFAEPFTVETQNAMITSFDFPKTVYAGFKSSGKVIFENNSGQSLDEALISIQSAPYNLFINRKEQHIPPFAQIVIPVTLSIPNYLTVSQGRLQATVNGEIANYYYDIRPVYWIIMPVSIGGIFILLGIFIVVTKRKWKIFRLH